MHTTTKRIIVIVAVVIAIAILYFFYLSDNSGTDDVSLVAGTGESYVDPALVSFFESVKAIQLDGALFSDPVFSSLEDYGTDPVPQPAGRENPFAPATR